MSKLPEDLLEEILCRVPATILKRLRYTCKRWNRLFNDKRFTRKHFDKAAKQFLFVVLKESRVCSIMRTHLHGFSPEKLSLTQLHSSLDQTEIFEVSHCEGLLLCVTNTALVVWNPCTGQTRLINNPHKQFTTTYALGSYQEKKSNDISYKILSQRGCGGPNKEFEIYEINSNSWRILHVTTDFSIRGCLSWGVSLKGKNYWIASDKREGHHADILFLVSFDYTTERFERLCLPPQYRSYWNVSLSAVREEKLSVLIPRRMFTRKTTELWVTNKIGDETKVASWSMVLTVDLGHRFSAWAGGSFWIDEEKKVLVCCNNCVYKGYKKIHIVGEDNKVRTEDLELGLYVMFQV